MTTETVPEPLLLADLDWCLAQADPAQSGALWCLDEANRQLDANLVRLPANQWVEMHQEPDVDVLLLPVAGEGTLHTDTGPLDLAPHTLMWLPRGSRRAVQAGEPGLAYVTVHQRRAGLRIRLPQDPEALRLLEAREEAAGGGEAACMLPLLCPRCDMPVERLASRVCPNCGADTFR
jgi:hypothetical protein